MSSQLRLTVHQAADRLRQGKVIAYPTEAVYGLGCDPANETAVRLILKLKSRSEAAGLILIADRFEGLSPFIRPVDEKLLATALATWPGHVTWLFPRADTVPDWLAGKHTTIAVRVTAHPVCRALCKTFGGAVVSTSANPSGARPAINGPASGSASSRKLRDNDGEDLWLLRITRASP
ncbi:MAG: L-threonylcarbamoyladenylate synthase, partial [Burkholderiales bacterium]